MDERELKVKRIRYLAFHRASSQMEELLQRALNRVELGSLSGEDLDAVLEVVSLYDNELEEALYGKREVSEKVLRGLKVLGLV